MSNRAGGRPSRIAAICIAALFVFALPVAWLLTVAYLSARVENVEAVAFFVFDALPAATAFVFGVGVAGAVAMRQSKGSIAQSLLCGLLVGMLGVVWLALVSQIILAQRASRPVILSISIIAGAVGGLLVGWSCVRLLAARQGNRG